MATATSPFVDTTAVEAERWRITVETLYREQFTSLCRSAQRFVDTAHAAEEVVQESFTRFALMDTRPADGSELAYLRSIVMNEARSVLRRRRTHDRHVLRLHKPAEVDATADAAVASSVAVSVRQAIARLPLRQRQVVTMRYLIGLSEQAIADTLGISCGSVKTHASRATTAMRTHLAEVA